MVTIKNKYHYDYDVLIIGGGPGGSGLAYHLAKGGARVLVADAAQFPRDKVCGDGVSPVAIAELHAMGITDTDTFQKANEISRVGLFIKNDKVLIDLSKPDYLPFHARIIPRIELDYKIYLAAKDAGAIYLEDTRFLHYSITPQGVLVQLKQAEKTIQLTAKAIVGADGSRSSVARQMHGSNFNDAFQLLGLRAYFEDVNGPNDRVDIFFSKESFPGIYWMFPKGAHGANIGMAMVSATMPSRPTQVRELLNQHIHNNPDIKERIGKGTMKEKISGWPINFFNPSNQITGDRIILVGDAAGLINPLSGDGIQYALLSARWASETLIACISKNDFSSTFISQYRKKVDEELAYDFAFSNLLVQFGRNKTLSKLWMEIMGVLIARAKADKEYAAIIAGIFEGTYPSYKALSLSFILKSLLQGGESVLEGLASSSKNPATAIGAGLNLIQSTVNLLEEVKDHPRDQTRWIKGVVEKTITVAGHTLRQVTKKSTK